jgi:transcriptional regulator with XRE-family HTH domain
MQADRIGRRIREIRGFNLTQAEFGRILGVGQMQLSKYERSERADAGGASETKSSLGQEHRLDRDRLRRWSVKT